MLNNQLICFEVYKSKKQYTLVHKSHGYTWSHRAE